MDAQPLLSICRQCVNYTMTGVTHRVGISIFKLYFYVLFVLGFCLYVVMCCINH